MITIQIITQIVKEINKLHDIYLVNPIFISVQTRDHYQISFHITKKQSEENPISQNLSYFVFKTYKLIYSTLTRKGAVFTKCSHTSVSFVCTRFYDINYPRVEWSPGIWETGVQSQVESYQKIKMGIWCHFV